MDQSAKTLAQLSEEGKEKKFVTLEVGAKLSGYTKDYLERLCRLNKVEYRLWTNDQHVIELESLLRETHTILLSYEGITFVDKNELTVPAPVSEILPTSAALKTVSTVTASPPPLADDIPLVSPAVATEEITLTPQIPRFTEITRVDGKVSDFGTLSFVGRAVVSDPLHPEEMKDEGSRATPQDLVEQPLPKVEAKIPTPTLPPLPQFEISTPLPVEKQKVVSQIAPVSEEKKISTALPVPKEKENVAAAPLPEVKVAPKATEKVEDSFPIKPPSPISASVAVSNPVTVKTEMPPPVFPHIPIMSPMLNVNMKTPLSGRPMPKIEVESIPEQSSVPTTPSQPSLKIPVPHKPGMQDIIGASMFAKPTWERQEQSRTKNESLSSRTAQIPEVKDHWDELLLNQKVTREQSPYHPIQTSLDATEHHESLPLFPALFAKVSPALTPEISEKEANLPSRVPVAVPAMRTMHQMMRDAQKEALPVVASEHLPSVRESHPLMKSPGFNIAFAIMIVASPFLLGGLVVQKFSPPNGITQVAGVGAVTENFQSPPQAVSPSPVTLTLPFSDEVLVSKGSKANSIVVRPVFLHETGKPYEYAIVPMASSTEKNAE